MRTRIWIASLVCLFACAAGCNKQANDQAAIRASIDKHLAERSDLNMSAMDREVKQITINGDQATAQVEFHLKQGGGNMQVNYALERRGGEWSVLTSQPAAGDAMHTAPQSGQENGIEQPGAPGPQSGPQGSFPQFDDLLRSKPAQGSDQVPPGHPPVN